ncbi:MAG: hypothetical protein M3Y24_05440, partial [Acidobacteriota bacterium]|nr:hypothetical protein [Acidobacteriota bacterium]
PHSLATESVTSRTAVYGPVRTVVWQGSVGDRRPYADLVGHPEVRPKQSGGFLLANSSCWLKQLSQMIIQFLERILTATRL